MNVKELSPKLALNKAFLKIKPNRTEIELFKSNLITLLDKLKTVEDRPKDESEEHLKTDIRDFLRDTFYKDKNAINTKDRSDLVIHESKDTNSNVAVIIEAKRPSNKGEMLSKDNLNKKALQELVLYYLRERITHKNLEVKHLIITNINEWYIFDEHLFERLFNKKDLVNQFESFEHGKKSTSIFYKEIAEPFIQSITNEIEYTYFNLKDYESALRNQDKNDDKQLIELFKLLSPPHLLKLPFNNDSNSLDKNFYGELLHIIGLVEVKDGGKKLIQRPEDEKKRNPGSLLENTINQLDSLDKLSRLTNLKQYGETQEERLFNVGLELCITWVNRILFLKLLEAQLISYHKGDKSYSFLNQNLIHDYDNLNSLFFMVLARKPEDRNQRVKDLFSKVPYLNSSLFEPTVLEHEALFISGLEDNIQLPFLNSTVNKDNHGNKEKGSREGLAYLFDFLSSYNFTSDSSVDIQEDNKTLINASVLGLIFEKINGYKDGSFFTPGFITEYMCRETIRRSVVQKFNETKSWNCSDFNDLYNKIEDINEANDIINEIKICDPAVGSGHFLVSALNEMLSVKNDLNILQDKDGKRLRGYRIEVINDELVVTDEDSDLYEYNPLNKESQRIQETLFHEKQTIIENCLFGVDINPNSVKICRLRLWIELLKNAYYKKPNELETLPNIDINIKCGNSLVSRFPIDTDMKEVMKNSRWTIDEYKKAVDTYRNAESKDQKREMEALINNIKTDFRKEIGQNTKEQRDLIRLKEELYQKHYAPKLFEDLNSPTLKKKREKDKKELENKIEHISNIIEEIKFNKIYENAFEWRFEFPEILDKQGDFIGFDLVIGNPPYVGITEISQQYKIYYETIFKTAKGRFDLYTLFIERAMQIKRPTGVFTYIIPGKFLNNKQFVTARKIVCDNHGVTVVKIDDKVFEDAQVDSVIVENYPDKNAKYKAFQITTEKLQKISEVELFKITSDEELIFRLEMSAANEELISKIKKDTVRVINIGEVKDGIIAGRIKDLLFIDEKIDEDCHKLYFGKQITRYHLADTKVWVNYKPKEMMVQEMKRVGNTGPGLRMRDVAIFEREKIIYRKVGKELIATLASKGVFYEQTVHSCHITDKKVRVKFVLGLFNSTLFKFYYHHTNSQGGAIFPQVRISSVENLPIKIADTETQEKIETLVNQILTKKSEDHSSDTSVIENKIDTLVYKLYNLTTEEIKIIEGE
jgi:hypothetical protein